MSSSEIEKNSVLSSPKSSSPHPITSPSSIPARSSPTTTTLPQYFQPLSNSCQHSANAAAKGNLQQQQTLNVAPQVLPIAPVLEGASFESQVQVPLQADGSSSVGTSNASSASKEAVILGLQALERQQEELERRQKEELERKKASIRSRGVTTVMRDNPFDASPREVQRHARDSIYKGDVPSMVHLPANENDSFRTLSSINRDNSACERKGKKSIGKILRSSLKIKRRSENNRSNDKTGNSIEQDGDDAQLSGSRNPDKSKSSAKKTSLSYNKPIIAGYLFKRGRQGKWQRRWFESDGKDLLYFKSNKRKKLLATLDLMHVGSISMDNVDPSSCSFIIEVAGRDFNLCADSKDHAMDWVISLNRVREARMGFGNLQLIEPSQNEDKDLEEECSPRVVMVARRKRAKVLGVDDFNGSTEGSNNVSGFTGALSPASGADSIASSNISSKIIVSEHLGHPHPHRIGVLGRWKKRRPSYQNWMRRLSRWAKRLTKVRCVVKDDFKHLDKAAKDKHEKDKAQKAALADANDSKPQAKYEEEVSIQARTKNSGLECTVDPASKFSHYNDIDPVGIPLNQISEGDSTVNDPPSLQANDEVYSSFEQKSKAATSPWGIGSQKRATRKKVDEISLRENNTNEDTDSASGRESPLSSAPISIDEEGSGVV